MRSHRCGSQSGPPPALPAAPPHARGGSGRSLQQKHVQPAVVDTRVRNKCNKADGVLTWAAHPFIVVQVVVQRVQGMKEASAQFSEGVHKGM